ncbi:hypothetical protein C8J56DRAFT_1030187 [Mycena floridula]|nr:hypothetical protein C8J56DRAFT_1030187 [Mycena floridula]
MDRSKHAPRQVRITSLRDDDETTTERRRANGESDDMEGMKHTTKQTTKAKHQLGLSHRVFLVSISTNGLVLPLNCPQKLSSVVSQSLFWPLFISTHETTSCPSNMNKTSEEIKLQGQSRSWQKKDFRSTLHLRLRQKAGRASEERGAAAGQAS